MTRVGRGEINCLLKSLMGDCSSGSKGFEWSSLCCRHMKKDAAAGLSRLLLNELRMTASGYSRKLLFESFICGTLLLSGRGSSETEEGPRYDCAWTDSCCAGRLRLRRQRATVSSGLTGKSWEFDCATLNSYG